MNPHITRFILAGTAVALTSIVNIAEAQVLGQSLGGSLRGGLNAASGSLNGAGSFGGALDSASTLGRGRGSLTRVGDSARGTSERLRNRTRSTAAAVRGEAEGAANDATTSGRNTADVLQQESSALTDVDAATSAAANAAGELELQNSAMQSVANGSPSLPLPAEVDPAATLPHSSGQDAPSTPGTLTEQTTSTTGNKSVIAQLRGEGEGSATTNGSVSAPQTVSAMSADNSLPNEELLSGVPSNESASGEAKGGLLTSAAPMGEQSPQPAAYAPHVAASAYANADGNAEVSASPR